MYGKCATTRSIPKVKYVEKDLCPISLTCLLSRELKTHIVEWHWELVLYLMDPCQYDVMATCSALHALVEICHEWFSKTDDTGEKNCMYTVLVDYSKSFN